MRFESKHREIKFYTNATTSRKNLPVSIGKKCMSKFAYTILQNAGFKQSLIINELENSLQISEKPYFTSIEKKLCLNSSSNFQLASSITYRNTLFIK